MAPSIPPSLTVRWSRDGLGIFSVLLSGGTPSAEVLWAAGGTTVSKLLSRETEREDGELKSVCVVLRGGQERHVHSTYTTQTEYNTTSNNQDKPWACSAGIRPPDCNAECEEMNEGLVGEDEEEDPSYINTVRLNECLRVTVEITHPALRLPAYLTWTGT